MLLLIEARCLCSKMSGSIWRKGSAPSVFGSYRDCSHSKTLPPGTLIFPLSFGIVGCHLYFTTWMEICFRISIPRSNVLAVSVRIKAFSKNQGLSQSYQKCTAAHHNHEHSANCTVLECKLHNVHLNSENCSAICTLTIVNLIAQFLIITISFAPPHLIIKRSAVLSWKEDDCNAT